MAIPGLSRRAFVLLAAVPFSAAAASDRKNISGIGFLRIRNGRANRRYLVIHGDESTARDTLIEHMKSAPGVAFLIDGRTRTVRPHLLEIDPNRMFSAAGAALSLSRLNPSASPAAIQRELRWLDARRHQLLEALLPAPGGLLIALHNNSRGYSIQSEAPISNRVHLPAPSTPHDFFLATSESDFNLIARGPYNAVLQSGARGPDDGSLSRLCAGRSIRYVNLECALGNRAAQAEMLNWLDRLLP
ncbi:MAG: hypothetical protein C0504_09835 [Candidatus Solibacter sp.]|nr:hypothetical protein [Candidatus Solibacter sp.]